MLMPVKPLSLFICCLLAVMHVAAQAPFPGSKHRPDTTDLSIRHTIRSIVVLGPKKTRPFIIRREFALEEGRSYLLPDIISGIRTTRQNLINTALFVDVVVQPCDWEADTLDILVEVKERWYYWPFFYFKPIDRNWNVWLNQYEGSLERVNYGVKLKGDNITGRNDKINIWIIDGYARQLTLKYFNPFADKSLRHGYGFELSRSFTREVNYGSLGNRQQFFKADDGFMRKQYYAGLTYSYRKGSVNRHTARLGMAKEWISDSILLRNPAFLGKGQREVNYPLLNYHFQHLDVDYIPYPNRGHTFEFQFTKQGLGGPVDLWQFNARASRHWPLARKMFFSLQGDVGIKLPFDQPFINRNLMGYGDVFLRGLEYYVIDGVAGGVMRSTLRRRVADWRLRTGLKSKTYGVIPLQCYAKTFADVGYVHDPQRNADDRLANRFMYTGGVGLDVITIYDWVVRLEFSFNQFREGGFFFHKNPF
jgi:outer membrane protein assembly factor BamA